MAGAADRHPAVALVVAPSPRVDGAWGGLRASAAALPPSLLALALAGVALVAHAALWGVAAPWGRAGAAGALLAAAGVLWGLWAWATFRLAGTPVALTDMPLQLIEEGPYRFGRNPMCLGTFAVLLGAALALGSPPLAVGALLFGSVVNAVHIPLEEARLARRFGGWYRDYTGATRRWL